MAQGLQVFDENGVNIFDTNTQNTKILGLVEKTNNNDHTEYIYSDLFITNTPFFIITPPSINIASSNIQIFFIGNKCEVRHKANMKYKIIVGVY